MQSLTVAVATVALCAAAPPPAAAEKAPRPPSCKKIRDAVWAGRTLEQIVAEFDTDAAYVMKCTQKQGKRRAAPKSKGKKASKPGTKSAGGTTSSRSKSQPAPPVQRPSSGRAAPQYLP